MQLPTLFIAILAGFGAFGLAGLISYQSFWGEATVVKPSATYRLGEKGPDLTVAILPEPVPRNATARLFAIRVTQAWKPGAEAQFSNTLSAAREELKNNLKSKAP